MSGRVLSLTAAQLVSGVATYVTQALVAQGIGPARFAIFGVLWSATYLVSQLLFIALQYSMTRFVSDYKARGKRPFDALKPLLRAQALLTVAFVIVVTLASRQLLDRVFSGELSVLLAFVFAVTFYSATSVLRSVVLGLSLFGAVAVILSLETVLRLLVAVIVVYVFDLGLPGAAASVVAGTAASLLILPVAYRQFSGQLALGEPEDLPVRRALRFSVPTFVAVGSQQIVLNSPAIVVQVFGTSATRATLASFYAGFLVTRIPHYVVSPLLSTMLPGFTTSASLDDTARFRRQLITASALSLGLAPAMALGFGLVGPPALRVLFGPEFHLGRSHFALLAAGVGVFLLADVLHLAMVARGRTIVSALSWLAGLAGYALFLVVAGAGSLYSVELGMLVAVALPAGILWVVHRNTEGVSTQSAGTG